MPKKSIAKNLIFLLTAFNCVLHSIIHKCIYEFLFKLYREENMMNKLLPRKNLCFKRLVSRKKPAKPAVCLAKLKT